MYATHTSSFSLRCKTFHNLCSTTIASMPKRMYEEGEIDDDVQETCRLVESATLGFLYDLKKSTQATEITENTSDMEHRSSSKQISDTKSEGTDEGDNWNICEEPIDSELKTRVEKRPSEEATERENVLVLWNKFRWTSPDTWKKVTTRNETPHSLLLKYYISSHYKTTPFNSVHENILLILRLLNE